MAYTRLNAVLDTWLCDLRWYRRLAKGRWYHVGVKSVSVQYWTRNPIVNDYEYLITIEDYTA